MEKLKLYSSHLLVSGHNSILNNHNNLELELIGNSICSQFQQHFICAIYYSCTTNTTQSLFCSVLTGKQSQFYIIPAVPLNRVKVTNLVDFSIERSTHTTFTLNIFCLSAKQRQFQQKQQQKRSKIQIASKKRHCGGGQK